ncbi:MAG: hypothetical protein ACREPG_01910, partial [Candidatus Binatia bacterium]
VQGREAGNYHFTSGLPVTVLKYLAPAIVARLENKPIVQPATPGVQTTPPNIRASAEMKHALVFGISDLKSQIAKGCVPKCEIWNLESVI